LRHSFYRMDWRRAELAWWSALKERFAPRPKFRVVPKCGDA
jgi:hypothetical protein